MWKKWFLSGMILLGLVNGCTLPDIALAAAKQKVKENYASCVLLKDGKIIASERGRGIAPLLKVHDEYPAEMAGGVLVDKVIGKAAALIAIHDAARPFASEDLIRTVISKASVAGAAAPAIAVKDTIKVARGGLVEYTPDRATLFAVQTPQVFDAALIRAALQKALDDGAEVTDDCSAVERLGMKVTLTEGDERNIKLTTPNDMLLAEMMLQEVRK